MSSHISACASLVSPIPSRDVTLCYFTLRYVTLRYVTLTFPVLSVVLLSLLNCHAFASKKTARPFSRLILFCVGSYEPELHPGVTFRIKEIKATLKVFSTGSITVTGEITHRRHSHGHWRQTTRALKSHVLSRVSNKQSERPTSNKFVLHEVISCGYIFFLFCAKIATMEHNQYYCDITLKRSRYCALLVTFYPRSRLHWVLRIKLFRVFFPYGALSGPGDGVKEDRLPV